MPFIKFKIEAHPDLESIARPLRQFRATALDKQLESLSIVIHRKIQDEAPERSGNLKKSIQRKRRGQFDYDIFVDRRMKGGKYERAIRLGIPAEKMNPILPRKKKALFWPGLPHPVKAVYNHPGIKANPYWDRGLDRAQSDIDRAEQLIGSKIETELIEKN